LANPKITSEWFKKAKQDLRKAEYFYESKDEDFYDGAIYFCQQTIEKLFKGFLVNKNVRVSKIHDLSALGESELQHIDAAAGAKLNLNFEHLESITSYAAAHRYPDAKFDLPPLTASTILSALDLAKKILAELSQQIHPEN
jgi:HEPN domain-containing protein